MHSGSGPNTCKVCSFLTKYQAALPIAVRWSSHTFIHVMLEDKM